MQVKCMNFSWVTGSFGSCLEGRSIRITSKHDLDNVISIVNETVQCLSRKILIN